MEQLGSGSSNLMVKINNACLENQSEIFEKKDGDYQYARAEMWRTVACGKSLSLNQWVQNLFSCIGYHLGFDCICIYSIHKGEDARKVAQWDLCDLFPDFVTVIPAAVVFGLLGSIEQKPVVYIQHESQGGYHRDLFKRFNEVPLSIIPLELNQLLFLIFLPGITSERSWRTWEIELLSESMQILSSKLKPAPSSKIPFSETVETNLPGVDELERQLTKIKYLESLTVLAGGIANDFNTILAQIYSRLFMIKTRLPQRDDIGHWINEAEQAAYKAYCLSKKLSFFSDGIVKENISIKSLIEDSVGFILKNSTVDYVLNLPENLWSVEIDKGCIEQVIKILVENAAQSMVDKGSVTISAVNCTLKFPNSLVRSCCQLPPENGDYVKISITDQGCGIPEELKENVFIPYFTTKLEGGGLGLTTAYAIIRQHGGYICFLSSQGRGSTFIIYLPVADTQVKQDLKRLNLNGTDAIHVLLVAEEPFIRIILRKWLSVSAFRVMMASSVEQALGVCKEKNKFGDPFSLVIIDLSISNPDSKKEKILQFKAVLPEVKVVGYCSGSENQEILKCREYGLDAFWGKTISLNDLATVIKDVLSEGSTIEV